jgi:hypothetical protein
LFFAPIDRQMPRRRRRRRETDDDDTWALNAAAKTVALIGLGYVSYKWVQKPRKKSIPLRKTADSEDLEPVTVLDLSPESIHILVFGQDKRTVKAQLAYHVKQFGGIDTGLLLPVIVNMVRKMFNDEEFGKLELKLKERKINKDYLMVRMSPLLIELVHEQVITTKDITNFLANVRWGLETYEFMTVNPYWRSVTPAFIQSYITSTPPVLPQKTKLESTLENVEQHFGDWKNIKWPPEEKILERQEPSIPGAFPEDFVASFRSAKYNWPILRKNGKKDGRAEDRGGARYLPAPPGHGYKPRQHP